MSKNFPMIITKIELVEEYPYHYRVTFNNIWRLINTYKQLTDSDNWEEVKNIIILIERKRKIYKLLNNNNKIYKDITIFEKNNY